MLDLAIRNKEGRKQITKYTLSPTFNHAYTGNVISTNITSNLSMKELTSYNVDKTEGQTLSMSDSKGITTVLANKIQSHTTSYVKYDTSAFNRPELAIICRLMVVAQQSGVDDSLCYAQLMQRFMNELSLDSETTNFACSFNLDVVDDEKTKFHFMPTSLYN